MSIHTDIQPERLAESVVRRLGNSSSEISAYWLAVSGDRDEYAAVLREAFNRHPVAVFVVRDLSFSNPNSVAADVINIMNTNRKEAEERLFPHAVDIHCGVILLGRSALAIPQASSPVTLPDWFPIRPGETVNILIEDLTWTVEAPLNCPEARIGEICEALYGLEGELIRRLKYVNEYKHNAGNAWLEAIRIDSDVNRKYSELLVAFGDYHGEVSNPTAFRPSLRASESLISRMWRIVQGRNPEALHGPGKALATALAIRDVTGVANESFPAVLSRPSTPEPSLEKRFTRSLLVSVASGCQFVTAAAHADGYARYPIPLLISFSYDLRRALRATEDALRNQPQLA